MDDQTDPATAESAPLIPPAEPTPRSRPSRTVAFSTPSVPTASRATSAQRRTPQTRAGHASGSYPTFTTGAVNPTVLAALNNRLRRRNSGGSIPTGLPPPNFPKLGPQRSSKTAQKLKLLPEPNIDEEEPEPDADEVREREVYSQFARIKDPTARRDAARLGKADRERLPRVTAYCTANRYSQDLLLRFFKGRGKKRGANPKMIDECIYSPYRYGAEGGEDSGVGLEAESAARHERRHSADLGAITRGYEPSGGEAEGVHDRSFGEFAAGSEERVGNSPDFDTAVHTPEVFAFDYGVVVVWGMTVAEEKRFLKEISRFEIEPLSPELIELEEFNFYYTREYQPRIYNDFITLRDKHSYMTKLAISHALAQSVKVRPPAPSQSTRMKLANAGAQTSLFEELMASTIETCKEIPNQISLTGKVLLPRSQINMQIGELFSLRIDIHLNGSVLDTPEVFWVEPHLEPVYQAVRSYLEMDQRVSVLTDRLDVIADLLAVLKDLLSHGHGEKLEWIGELWMGSPVCVREC